MCLAHGDGMLIGIQHTHTELRVSASTEGVCKHKNRIGLLRASVINGANIHTAQGYGSPDYGHFDTL